MEIKIKEDITDIGNLNTSECFKNFITETEVNEGLAKAVALGSLLFIPLYASATDIQNALPKDKVVYTRSDIKNAMEKSYSLKTTYGGMRASNVCNIVAKTIWDEARGITEGSEGRKAVLSVILNRYGGDADNVIKVIKKPLAFSGWNSYTGGWTDATYDFFEPTSIKYNSVDADIWRECNELASKFLAGEFTSTIGNFNSYMNKKTADKKNVDSWGKQCNLKIGRHHFGYLPENDGFRRNVKTKKTVDNKSVTVTVKSGDTIGKIAAEHNTTIEKILKKNKSIKDKDKIRVGQKIKI